MSSATNFNYNGLDLNETTGYSIINADGLAGNQFRISQDNLTVMDGGNVWRRFNAMRVISLQGIILGTTVDDYFAKRNALINTFDKDSDDLLTITLWDGSIKQIRAKCTMAPEIKDAALQITHSPFEIQLTCENPYFESTTEVTGSLAAQEAGGTPVPTPIPFPVGGANATLSLINSSSIPVYPTITISGQITNAYVVNLTTGVDFTITSNVAAGSDVVVSMGPEGLGVDYEGVNWQTYFEGDIIRVEPGINTFNFSGSSFDENALVTISFNELSLSI